MQRRRWMGRRSAERRGHEALSELTETRMPLLEARAAAVELQDTFRLLARALRPGDNSTQDDLVQEMCLGALKCSDALHTRSYFLQLGVARALNYLRWWDEPLTGPLDAESDEPAAREKIAGPAKERCLEAVPAA
ncbi:MAG: hypothetical protein NTW87_04225 [Planctomycetota bacterium]|nr:hypothetical protein [Planctomycetota bacterium]